MKYTVEVFQDVMLTKYKYTALPFPMRITFSHKHILCGVIAAPGVRSVDSIFAHLYILVDKSEHP